MSVPAWLSRLVEGATRAERSGLCSRALCLALAGLAGLYGAGVRLRNLGYDRGVLPTRRLPCRVICVGNLTVGGTGKTPTVIWLAGALADAGRRVAVVLRGYGRRAPAGVRIVSDGRGLQEDWPAVGDEAVLIARRLPTVPIVVGADRHAAGLAALAAFDPDVMVLDDGFQHRRLHRDVDLLLVDATDPFGGGRLVPRGRLREGREAVRRAHAVLLTRSDETDRTPALLHELAGMAPGLPVACAIHRPTAVMALPDGVPAAPEALHGFRVLALSGIANPRSFRRTVESLGMEVAGELAYPDHYPYGAAARAEIGRTARHLGAQAVVTTEKDAVRLGRSLPAGVPLYSVRIDLALVGGREGLERALGLDCRGSGRG
jgi:tetraacyldisaccharide 4'-kinase